MMGQAGKTLLHSYFCKQRILESLIDIKWIWRIARMMATVNECCRGGIMQIEKLRVSGITCDGWAREVRKALASVHGVNDVKVTLGSGDAEVSFDEKLASLDDVKMALLQEGFSFSTPENCGL